MGRFTTEQDINQAGQIIVDVVNEQRQFGGLNVA